VVQELEIQAETEKEDQEDQVVETDLLEQERILVDQEVELQDKEIQETLITVDMVAAVEEKLAVDQVQVKMVDQEEVQVFQEIQ
jgi:hypothetical protein